MQRHAITDRKHFNGDGPAQLRAMVEAAVSCASDGRNNGADVIQLREKDLPAGAVEALARELTERIRSATAMTRVVVNGRPDVAIAAGADGIHMPANEALPVADVRELFYRISRPEMLIGLSCHTIDEITAAAAQEPDYIFYGPIFEKHTPDGLIPGLGLEALAPAVQAAGEIPVIAIGGLTRANEWDCVRAGAAGVAAIRMFLP
jgi:thiamine-phosphate pyrophosphorylase